MFPVAVLAGGLATRLRPITRTIPKALVDVAGKPFIVRQLNYLREQQIERVVLCVGYLGDLIQGAVGDGRNFGIKVSYSADGESLLGTGGALAKAIPQLGNEFFVLYGDSFLPIKFSAAQEAYQSSGQDALMTVLRNNNRWDTSNVLYSNGTIQEYNKRKPREEMNHVDYGLGVVSRKVFEPYSDGIPFDLADIYHNLSLKGKLAGLEVHERFYEIGSHVGLKETENYFFAKERS